MVAPVHAVPLAIAASHLNPTDPADPIRHSIVYSSKLHPNAKFLFCTPLGCALGPKACLACMTCAPLCNLCMFDKLSARSYIRVYENALATNHATTCCFGLTVCDLPSLQHLDKTLDSVQSPNTCTPGHCFCCIPCAGNVVAFAPTNCLNTCFCPCCRDFIGGVDDGNRLVSAIVSARDVVRQGQNADSDIGVGVSDWV